MSAGSDFSPRRARTAKAREFLLRPIRPDDAARLIEAFRLCDPEDLRLRFFRTLSSLSERLAARLSDIDSDHEMAIVATQPVGASEAIAGIVRLIYATPDEPAEFGVIVRSDMKKLGLGGLLMRAILDHAAAVGVQQVVGYVLTENDAMLRMARRLGATIEREKTDVTMTRVLFDIHGNGSGRGQENGVRA